jgi:hypothetical protein
MTEAADSTAAAEATCPERKTVSLRVWFKSIRGLISLCKQRISTQPAIRVTTLPACLHTTTPGQRRRCPDG